MLTDLAMAMSAAIALMLTPAESLPATGSGWFSTVLVAVLVVAAVVLTVATMERVAVAPLASGPMFQIPVPEL